MKRISLGASVITLALVAMSTVCPVAGASLSPGGNGWFWQNPLPQGSSYWSAWFNDADHGWLVSDRTIFHTSNGGATVSIQARHKVAFLDVTFADAKHGWAVGYPANADTDRVVIYRTVNGGRYWSRVRVNVVGGLNAVSFANARVGWAVGDALLHTTDGGRHWSRQYSKHTSGLGLMGVQAVSARRAWVCGDGNLLLRTSNGGASWRRFPTTGSDGLLEQVQFTSPLIGWVTTDEAVLQTTDGGAHWVRSLVTRLSRKGLSFADSRNGWVASFDGTINHTTDGGATWASQPNQSGLMWVCALSPSVAITGGECISRTMDGVSWQSTTRAADDFYGSLNALQFVNAHDGWAAGSGGEILATTDGGVGWAAQASSTTEDLNGVHFSDAEHGWAVGDQGTITHTSDGGATWTAQTSGTSYDLTGVTFTDAQNGWATGQSFTPDDGYSSGVILHTTDGGQQWTTQYASTANPGIPTAGTAFSAVAFADAQHGWTVGETQGSDATFNQTVIMHTTNGGSTWKKQLSYSPPPNGNTSYAELTAVCCTDARHAVAVGYDDWRTEIFRTTNGGATWTKFAQSGSFPRRQLTGISFGDATHGWAVSSGASGFASAVIRTTDGGRTWAPQSLGSVETLTAVSFVSRTRGWVAGAGANILRTTTGGNAP